MSVSILNLTKSKIPSLSFSRMAREVLGRDFNLNVVVCGNQLSERLNCRRGGHGPTNVLSFKLPPIGVAPAGGQGPPSGEIFLNSDKIKREAGLFGRTLRQHWLNLYLHSLFHLAGYRHGRKMDQAVHKFAARFSRSV